jgi:hypothetical protein
MTRDSKSRDGRKIIKGGKGGKVQTDGSLHHDKLTGQEMFPTALDKGDPNFNANHEVDVPNISKRPGEASYNLAISSPTASNRSSAAIAGSNSRNPHNSVSHQKPSRSDMAKVERLLQRQSENLPRAIAQMQQHGKKNGHWAW